MRRFTLLSILWLMAFRPLVVLAAESDAREFAAANGALQRGAFTEAIDMLELLADRGFVHPDASFNRGAAYVGRARSSAAAPGDLGRAAAALAEVLVLRPDDEEADKALARVRAEISRRHVREGAAPVMARASLGRAVSSLLSENVWAATALAGSLLLALGLALRRFLAFTSATLAGAIAIGMGSVLLVTGAALTASARRLRLTTAPAIIVADEARLLDESGKPLPQRSGSADSVTIPEGASVYVLERRPALFKVEWGAGGGWLTPGQVRILASR